MRRGFPIRTSADQRSLASPRGFSQRATSFIAFWRQGIHRTPLSHSLSLIITTARAQDQTATPTPLEANATPGPLGTAAHITHNFLRHPTRHRTTSPSARHTDDTQSVSPDPIHSLKEHAHHQAKARQGNYLFEGSWHRTGSHPLKAPLQQPVSQGADFATWRLTDSNR